jgi:hypothetical protein
VSSRYVGELISDAEADSREDDSYLFDLDKKVKDQHISIRIVAKHLGSIFQLLS